jgi:hypothetical protein
VEEGLVDRAPVRLGGVEDTAALGERLDEPLADQYRARRADQVEIGVGALVGDEEPAGRDAPAGHRLEAAAERQVCGYAMLVQAAELQPGVAEPLLVAAAEQEVPLHPFGGICVRRHPVGRQLAVEQERQGEREHLGLARAVVAAQQQVAVAEAELLVVVEKQVDQAGAQRLPALPPRQRQPAAVLPPPPVAGGALAVARRVLAVPLVGGHADAPTPRSPSMAGSA